MALASTLARKRSLHSICVRCAQTRGQTTTFGYRRHFVTVSKGLETVGLETVTKRGVFLVEVCSQAKRMYFVLIHSHLYECVLASLVLVYESGLKIHTCCTRARGRTAHERVWQKQWRWQQQQ